jgi:hypothetical protein
MQKLAYLDFTPLLTCHRITTFVDGTKSSLRVDTQPPWADLPTSVLGSVRSQTPSKIWHTKCVLHKWYPLEALVIMHEDT